MAKTAAGRGLGGDLRHLGDTGQNQSQLKHSIQIDNSHPLFQFKLTRSEKFSAIDFGLNVVCIQLESIKLLPSGLQPTCMRVSGHSQLPVAGLKARPGSQGIPFAVTREQTPGGPGGGRTCRAEGWGGSSRLARV